MMKILVLGVTLVAMCFSGTATAADTNYVEQAKVLLRYLYVDAVSEEILASDDIGTILARLDDPSTKYFPPEDSQGRTMEQVVGDDIETEAKNAMYAILDDKIGYIQIGSFTAKTAVEVKSALSQFEKEAVQGLIIDLRNNRGGKLDSVIAVAELLIPSSPVTHIYSRNRIVTSYHTEGAGTDLPMVMMMNSATASAAEIFISAVKDNKLGLSVGTKTYGKASIQSVYRLSNNGIFSLTTYQYLTPQGKAIHGQGLKPDYPVTDPEAQLVTAKQLITGLINGNIDTNRVRNWTFIDVGYRDYYVNGVKRQFQNVPFSEQNITYVPLREISENLGAQVTFREETKDIIVENFRLNLTKPEIDMQFNLNSPVCYIDGSVKNMNYPLIVKDGRAYIHVRFLAEQVGAQVYWMPEIQRVAIGF